MYEKEIELIATDLINGNYKEAIKVLQYKCKTQPRVFAHKTGVITIALCKRGLEKQVNRMLRLL